MLDLNKEKITNFINDYDFSLNGYNSKLIYNDQIESLRFGKLIKNVDWFGSCKVYKKNNGIINYDFYKLIFIDDRDAIICNIPSLGNGYDFFK